MRLAHLCLGLLRPQQVHLVHVGQRKIRAIRYLAHPEHQARNRMSGDATSQVIIQTADGLLFLIEKLFAFQTMFATSLALIWHRWYVSAVQRYHHRHLCSSLIQQSACERTTTSSSCSRSDSSYTGVQVLVRDHALVPSQDRDHTGACCAAAHVSPVQGRAVRELGAADCRDLLFMICISQRRSLACRSNPRRIVFLFMSIISVAETRSLCSVLRKGGGRVAL